LGSSKNVFQLPDGLCWRSAFLARPVSVPEQVGALVSRLCPAFDSGSYDLLIPPLFALRKLAPRLSRTDAKGLGVERILLIMLGVIDELTPPARKAVL